MLICDFLLESAIPGDIREPWRHHCSRAWSHSIDRVLSSRWTGAVWCPGCYHWWMFSWYTNSSVSLLAFQFVILSLASWATVITRRQTLYCKTLLTKARSWIEAGPSSTSQGSGSLVLIEVRSLIQARSPIGAGSPHKLGVHLVPYDTISHLLLNDYDKTRVVLDFGSGKSKIRPFFRNPANVVFVLHQTDLIFLVHFVSIFA